MSTSAAEKTAKLIATLWERNLPIIRGRLDLLDRASALAPSGQLTSELRSEAAAGAHKLAGSLGMYGYTEGTLLAREIEHLLEPSSSSPDAARLQDLTRTLRRSLNL